MSRKSKDQSLFRKLKSAAPVYQRQQGHTREEQDFNVPLYFRNDMPPIPLPPKFLSVPFSTESLTKRRVSTLDMSSRPIPASDFGLGAASLLTKLARSPITIEKSDKHRPSREDSALLDNEERIGKGEAVEWLQRTIIDDGEVPADESTEPVQKVDQAGDGAKVDSVLDEIEEGFKINQRAPVHPRKPGMKAVKVYEVLPDFELWGDRAFVLQFDRDPCKAPPLQEGTEGSDGGWTEMAGTMAQPLVVGDQMGLAFLTPSVARVANDRVKKYMYREEYEMKKRLSRGTVALRNVDGKVYYRLIDDVFSLKRKRVADSRFLSSVLAAGRLDVEVETREPTEEERESHKQRKLELEG